MKNHILLLSAFLATAVFCTGCPDAKTYTSGINAEPDEVVTHENTPGEEYHTENIIEISEDAPISETETETYFQQELAKAEAAENRGETETASLIYQTLTIDFPNRAVLYHRLARIHEQKHETELADAFYGEALDRKPSDPAFFNDYGWFLFTIDKTAEAAAVLHRAVSLSPNEKKYKNNLALCNVKAGQYDEAFLLFKDTADDRSSEAYMNLALAQEMLRAPTEEVIKSLRKSLAHDPRNLAAQEFLESIEAEEDEE